MSDNEFLLLRSVEYSKQIDNFLFVYYKGFKIVKHYIDILAEYYYQYVQEHKSEYELSNKNLKSVDEAKKFILDFFGTTEKNKGKVLLGFVVCIDNEEYKTAGFLIGSTLAFPNSKNNKPHIFYINLIFLLPPYRGVKLSNGLTISHNFLEEFINYVKQKETDIKKLLLSVLEDNQRGKGLYYKAGFRPYETIMIKEL